MAYRTQSNPSSTSSDGVPPELAILGLREALPAPVRPVGSTGQTGLPRVLLVLIVLMIIACSRAFECVLARFCVNTLFGDSTGEEINLVFKTDLI